MKGLHLIILTVAVAGCVLYTSCAKEVLGPNELGGSTDVEFSKVGSRFASYLSPVDEHYIPGMDNMYDTILVTKNNNGIVTLHSDIGFDSAFVKALDSALGTSAMNPGLRNQAIDYYKQKFHATIDTSNPKKMHATFDLKMKVTTDGIQEFVSSNGDESKPFTIVKYGSAVGDKYEFTNSDGIKVTRAVTYHSTTDDYPIGFYMIKVMKVEETKEDLFLDKITYVTNHKFGLVGVIIQTKTGKQLHLGVFPPNM